MTKIVKNKTCSTVSLSLVRKRFVAPVPVKLAPAGMPGSEVEVEDEVYESILERADADETGAMQKWLDENVNVEDAPDDGDEPDPEPEPEPGTDTFLVIFDSDGGSEVEHQNVSAGGTATKPADPTKPGYTFAGWFVGDDAYDFASTVEANMTVKAKWEALPVITALSLTGPATVFCDPRLGSVPEAEAQLVFKVKREGDSAYSEVDAERIAAEGLSVSWSCDSNIASIDGDGLAKLTALGKSTFTLEVSEPSGNTVSKAKSVTYDTYSFAIGEQCYSTLSAACKAAADDKGCTVLVMKGQELTGILNRITLAEGTEFTLDLGGKTLVMNGAYFTVNGASVSLANGSIESKGNAGQLFVMNSGELNVLSGASIDGKGNTGAVSMFGPATVNVAGTLTSVNTFALAGNGSSGKGGYTVNVTGTVSSSDSIALYHPNAGSVTISGGTVSGTTAVYQKCGNLSITGGSIVATGDKADYSYNGNGANPTGDALVVDSCGYPGGVPVPSVTGGEFSSANGQAVASYAGNGVADSVVGFVSGGKFKPAVASDLLASGRATQQDGEWSEVVIDGDYQPE